MGAEAILCEEERYAAHVSAVLEEKGLVTDEEAREVMRLLRGW